MEIYFLLYRLKEAGIVEYFCWVPANPGVSANEVADKRAKKKTKKNNE